ncbi:MAG: hypothetical protein RRX93_04275 [Bacteroidales bacterium]
MQKQVLQTRRFITLLLGFFLMYALSSCAAHQELCPAYGNSYHKEALPY